MAIQLFTPTFEIEECIDEIRDCLLKGWTGLGFKTVEFEEAWKKYTGFPFAYFVNSATAGLNMAVKILKEQNGWYNDDEIISTPITFVSTNHAISKSGMKVVFADVDDSLCLDPNSVVEKITPKTRAVMFVGMGGNIGKYEEIVKICEENSLLLILDAAHMAGTRYRGVVPGREADAVIYSYQAVKNLPTADSGMLCFKNGTYDEIARKIGWLGINKDTYTRTENSGNYKWRYNVEYIGNKYHGNSIMAAIALVQLRYLDRDNSYRRQIAQWYKNRLEKCEKIRFVNIPEGCESSTHLFQVLVEPRDELMLYLNSKDIFPGVHYVDNTEYEMYRYASGTCKMAQYVSDHVISLPVHLRMDYEDVSCICNEILSFLR